MAANKITHLLRNYRKLHKLLGLSLAILLIISAATGIFLGLKKEFDFIQPGTQKGSSKDLTEWLPIDTLAQLSIGAFREAHPQLAEAEIDRMDVRPSKGIIKVLIDKGWWEVQIDGANGEILSIARRNSDWIEQLHDGSIISDTFKLISMNTLGFGLLIMIFSGWFLWYGPRKFRQQKRKRRKSNV